MVLSFVLAFIVIAITSILVIGKYSNLNLKAFFLVIGKFLNHKVYDILRICSKPTNIQISKVKYDSVYLQWTKPDQGGDCITSYSIFCQSEDDPNKQWQIKWTSTQEKVKARGLEPKTRYIFKVRPECGNRHGIESDSSATVETKRKVPGKLCHKPFICSVKQDNVIVKWHEPVYGKSLVKRYHVLYRPYENSNGEWKKTIIEGCDRVAFIDGLHSETRYVFKVCAEGEFGISDESDESFPVRTHKLLSRCIKERSTKVSTEGVLPEIYALPRKYVVLSEGEQNIAQCVIGEPKESFNERVLMLVGATGAGKTTLLNAIANYIFGVRFEDNYRFKVEVSDHETDSSQAHSKTNWITAYKFFPVDGSPISYALTVIDTPGFGDTRGITRDKEIMTQISKFFSTEGENGIDHLNGVGVVVQSPSVRLTPTQKYIFDSVLSLFGKDISSKIFLMITFADGQEPPVLCAVKEAVIPYGSHFKFNNSSLLVMPVAESFAKNFWDMGTESFGDLFDNLEKTGAVSITLTKEVLIERERLQTILQGLQRKIADGLDKCNELQNVEEVLEKHESEMKINENFKYEVKVMKRLSVKLPSDKRALNCRKCFTTCHYPCDVRNNEHFNCLVMNNYGSKLATCNVCPSECSWEDHVTQNLRYQSYEGRETRTIKELKDLYDKASNKCKQVQDIINALEEELSQMQENVMNDIQQAKRCKQRLDEIALKPDKLTEIDYIELLIRSEMNEKNDGYEARIEALEEMKKAAQLLAQLSSEDRKPDKHNITKWWKDFRRQKKP